MISVDTKKKELIGNYAAAAGSGSAPASPARSMITTSPTGLIQVAPYGVDDLTANAAWATWDQRHTAQFASSRSAAGGI